MIHGKCRLTTTVNVKWPPSEFSPFSSSGKCTKNVAHKKPSKALVAPVSKNIALDAGIASIDGG